MSRVYFNSDGILDYGMTAADRYDWVSPNSRRTPEEYPYSHSEYYVWRTFDPHKDQGVEHYYSDRMASWDRPKYLAAIADRMQNFGSVPKSRKAAQDIVASYFGPEYECVGIIQSMNVSSGYPLGVFCIRKRAA